MYKLILCILLFVFISIGIPILINYAMNKMMKYISDDTKQQKIIYKENNKNSNTVNPLYLKARNLFNTGMKGGLLKRQDILDLIDLLEKILGKHIKAYKDFYFKNDCHKIYVYLKSKEISSSDMQQIINLLEVKHK